MNGLNNDTKYAILTKTPAPEKSMSVKFFFYILYIAEERSTEKRFSS